MQKLSCPFTISHKEGDIISLLFIDAKVEEDNQINIGKEYNMKYVKQIIVAVLIPEEGQDNSIDSHMPGLVNLKAIRQSEHEIYFTKLKKHSELQTLYQLGGQAAAGVSNPLPK